MVSNPRADTLEAARRERIKKLIETLAELVAEGGAVDAEVAPEFGMFLTSDLDDPQRTVVFTVPARRFDDLHAALHRAF